jgi:hypothetical protein
MKSNRVDRAKVTTTVGKATLSWVEIDGDWGRGYHEIAYRPKGFDEWTILETHLSRGEALTVFHLLISGKVTIDHAKNNVYYSNNQTNY